MLIKDFVTAVRRQANEIALSGEDTKSATTIATDGTSFVSDMDIVNFAFLESILLAAKVKSAHLRPYIGLTNFNAQEGSQQIEALRIVGDSVVSTFGFGTEMYVPRVTFSEHINRLNNSTARPYYRAADGYMFFYGNITHQNFSYNVVAVPEFTITPKPGYILGGTNLWIPAPDVIDYQLAFFNYTDLDKQDGLLRYVTKVDDSNYTVEDPPVDSNVALIYVQFLDLAQPLIDILIKYVAVTLVEMMDKYEIALEFRKEINTALSPYVLSRIS